MGKYENQNKYKIEHKISTLVHCATFKNERKPASFEIDGIDFCHSGFSHTDGWNKDEWIAKAIFEREDCNDAISKFRMQLFSIIPKISFISQAFIEFRLQPFLAHRYEHPLCFIKYASERKPVGLMFTDKEETALTELVANTEIPREFFLYWNDAVNTSGYSAKLLLIFSAIEAFTKKPNGKPNYKKRELLLGIDLKTEIFGAKGNSKSALRHRLVHGEYFTEKDRKNYLEVIHKKIISYFNLNILSKPLITEDVKNPQRHPWGNYKSWKGFIERLDNGNQFDLVDILENFENNGIEEPTKYRVVTNEEKY